MPWPGLPCPGLHCSDVLHESQFVARAPDVELAAVEEHRRVHIARDHPRLSRRRRRRSRHSAGAIQYRLHQLMTSGVQSCSPPFPDFLLPSRVFVLLHGQMLAEGVPCATGEVLSRL
jgi:hypothetical protein